MAGTGKKTIVASAILMVLMFVILYFGTTTMGMSKIDTYTIDNSQIVGIITRSNGKKDVGVSPKRWTLSKGDILDAYISLPSRRPFVSTNICFYVYNAEIEVSSDSKTLYSYGGDLARRHRQIGNVYVNFRVPESMWGKTLHLRLTEHEQTGTLQNAAFTLVSTDQSIMLPLKGNGVKFIIFGVFMVVGIFLFLYSLIIRRGGKSSILTTFIGLATFLLCVWYFGYNRYFYIISTNIRFNAMVEYYAIFLIPLPFIGFVYFSIEDKERRHIVLALGIIQSLLCVIAFALGLSGTIPLCDTLPMQQVLIAVIFLVSLWLFIEGTRKNRNGFESSLLVGISIGMAFAVIQIIAIRLMPLKSFPGSLMGLARVDYASIGLAVLIITLIISTMQRIFEDVRTQAEQDELEKLAFTDLLTGIPNRIFCTGKMKAITADEWYAVAFFDVDGLKKANDNFGHEVGDALIKQAANVIKETFHQEFGFYGRWGGDEFIAVFRDGDELSRFKYAFDSLVKITEEKNELPISFSISVGYYEHVPGADESVNDCINHADDAMYEVKKSKKAARSD
ncbi:MAG: GGDEF domain-containing protein [Candidatus Weimeria sp.]